MQFTSSKQALYFFEYFTGVIWGGSTREFGINSDANFLPNIFVSLFPRHFVLEVNTCFVLPSLNMGTVNNTEKERISLHHS